MVTIKTKVNWDMIKTATGLVLIALIFAVLLPVVAMNEAEKTNINATQVNSDDVIIQLISRFEVENITTSGNCVRITATTTDIKPLQKVDAVVFWCGDDVYVIAKAKIHR